MSSRAANQMACILTKITCWLRAKKQKYSSERGIFAASATPVTPADVPKVSGKVLSKAELLDKLVGPVTHHNPIHVMHERRVFFERLIEFCERNGDPITMVTREESGTNNNKMCVIIGAASLKTEHRSAPTLHWCARKRRFPGGHQGEVLEESVH